MEHKCDFNNFRSSYSTIPIFWYNLDNVIWRRLSLTARWKNQNWARTSISRLRTISESEIFISCNTTKFVPTFWYVRDNAIYNCLSLTALKTNQNSLRTKWNIDDMIIYCYFSITCLVTVNPYGSIRDGRYAYCASFCDICTCLCFELVAWEIKQKNKHVMIP